MTSRIRSAISPLPGSGAGDRERQRHVLGHVQQWDQVERLEDEAGPVAAELGRLVVGQVADRRALEDDLAGGRPVKPAEELEESRLARPRRAHQGDELALVDLQGDAAQGIDRRGAEAVALGEIVRLEDRGHPRECSGTPLLQDRVRRGWARLARRPGAP